MKRPAGFSPASTPRGDRSLEQRPSRTTAAPARPAAPDAAERRPAAPPAKAAAAAAPARPVDRSASIADLVGLARANRGTAAPVDREAETEPIAPLEAEASVVAPAAPGRSAPQPEAPVHGPKTHAEALEHLSPSWGERLAGWRDRARARRERRRVEKAEVRRFTKRSRIRRRIQLIGGAVVVAVIGGAVLTAFSPVMALKTITVEGTQRIKAADIQRALAGQLGKPLPLVSLDDIRHDLDDFRLIRSYSTEVHPPSTLVVRIAERTPLGVVKVGASYELVDQAGVVISATAAAPKGFPVVQLPAGQQPQVSPIFGAVAAVLADLPAAVLKQVKTATASSPDAVSFGLAGGKTVVWGGASDSALKASVLKALLKGAPHALVYDVSAPTSPVTRTDPPAPPAP